MYLLFNLTIPPSVRTKYKITRIKISAILAKYHLELFEVQFNTYVQVMNNKRALTKVKDPADDTLLTYNNHGRHKK